MDMHQLGHGGEGTEPVPRMIEALAANKLVGASAGTNHTAVTLDGGRGALHLWGLRLWGAGPRSGKV